MDFAKRLDSLMRESNLTISSLSKKTGISKSSLHGYMNGAEPSMNNLVKLAEHFDTSIDFLARGVIPGRDEELAKVKIHEGLYEVVVKKVVKKGDGGE